MAGPVKGAGKKVEVRPEWAFPKKNPLDDAGVEKMSGSMRLGTLSTGQSVANYRRQLGWSEARITQAEQDRGTVFERVNVPPAYRSMNVDADGMLMPIRKMELVAEVLDKLDPDRDLSWSDEPLPAKLVGLLTLPLQMGKRPQLVRALRAEVGVVQADTVTPHHAKLGEVLAEMQAWEKLPTKAEYLAKLYDAFQEGDPVDKAGGNGGGSVTKTEKTSRTTPSDPVTDPKNVVISRVRTGPLPSLWRWSTARMRVAMLAGRYVT